jgi:hypothetical protein
MSFVIKIDDIYCCERVVVVVRVPRRRRRRRRHIFSLSLSFERGLKMCGLFFYSSKAFKALSLVQTKGPTKIHTFDTLNCKTLNVMAIFFVAWDISLVLSSQRSPKTQHGESFLLRIITTRRPPPPPRQNGRRCVFVLSKGTTTTTRKDATNLYDY